MPIKKLEDLGILDQITSYSYRKDDFCYLFECDATTFIVAMDKTGEEYTWEAKFPPPLSLSRDNREKLPC